MSVSWSELGICGLEGRKKPVLGGRYRQVNSLQVINRLQNNQTKMHVPGEQPA